MVLNEEFWKGILERHGQWATWKHLANTPDWRAPCIKFKDIVQVVVENLNENTGHLTAFLLDGRMTEIRVLRKNSGKWSASILCYPPVLEIKNRSIARISTEEVVQKLKLCKSCSKLGFVYIVQTCSLEGYIKVGFSKNPVDRWNGNGTSTDNPDPIMYLGAFKASLKHEQMLHGLLLPYRYRGEWYFPVKEIKEIATKLNNKSLLL